LDRRSIGPVLTKGESVCVGTFYEVFLTIIHQVAHNFYLYVSSSSEFLVVERRIGSVQTPTTNKKREREREREREIQLKRLFVEKGGENYQYFFVARW
jgi:hypothetical protein